MTAYAVFQVHELVEKANVVRDDWNGYNVLHDSASRVAALDVGFLPSARASSAPKPKVVYLLGSDDYSEEDVPKDAFVIYQVSCSIRLPYFTSDSRESALAKPKACWAQSTVMRRTCSRTPLSSTTVLHCLCL